MTVTMSNAVKVQVNGGLLGLQGITLTQSGGGDDARLIITNGVLAIEDVVVQGLGSNVTSYGAITQEFGGRLLLSRTKMYGNKASGSGLGGAIYSESGFAELHNVRCFWEGRWQLSFLGVHNPPAR